MLNSQLKYNVNIVVLHLQAFMIITEYSILINVRKHLYYLCNSSKCHHDGKLIV